TPVPSRPPRGTAKGWGESTVGSSLSIRQSQALAFGTLTSSKRSTWKLPRESTIKTFLPQSVPSVARASRLPVNAIRGPGVRVAVGEPGVPVGVRVDVGELVAVTVSVWVGVGEGVGVAASNEKRSVKAPRSPPYPPSCTRYTCPPTTGATRRDVASPASSSHS